MFVSSTCKGARTLVRGRGHSWHHLRLRPYAHAPCSRRSTPVAVPLGTVKEQLKLPPVSVLSVPEEQMVTLLPASWRVMGLLAWKPPPTAVMLVPAGPWLGLKVIPAVTVNAPEAEFVPSLAVTG